LDWIETYWTADGFNPDSVVEASLRQPPRLPDAGLMPTRASVAQLVTTQSPASRETRQVKELCSDRQRSLASLLPSRLPLLQPVIDGLADFVWAVFLNEVQTFHQHILLVGEAASQLSDSACNENARLGINEQLG
jgi:hypothetical protein